MPDNAGNELRLVFAGHVDHGKSTIIGRLLADTGSLPQGKLDAVKKKCRRNARPFEYAFLLDALKDEQAQGITIDIARCFFKTAQRAYLIIDAPGHLEFLRNMVTGAAWADAALLVIDASEGMRENSRRHAYILAMLGIRQIVVLVNKMDLVAYQQSIYQKVVDDCQAYFAKIGLGAVTYIPVSGAQGDNIVTISPRMPWVVSPTVIEIIDGLTGKKAVVDQPLRLPVQDIYKFTAGQDNRRIIAGRVESGSIQVGDEVVFYPTGKKSRIKTIESFPSQTHIATVHAGSSLGITLADHLYICRGEIIAKATEAPLVVASRLQAKVFWLGNREMAAGSRYVLKLATARAEAVLEQIISVTDAATLETAAGGQAPKNSIADCIFVLDRPIAFDLGHEIPETGRFVLVEDYEIVGGGLITKALSSQNDDLQTAMRRRNAKWESGRVTDQQRAIRYNQTPVLILLTGPAGDETRKIVAWRLEEELFAEGRFVYCLGMRNLIYGLDADVKDGSFSEVARQDEHFRRLAEIAHLMLDAGMILIVMARDVAAHELEYFKTSFSGKAVSIIFESLASPEAAPQAEYVESKVLQLRQQLQS